MGSSIELRIRSIISFLQVSLGVLLFITGLVLYLIPSGRFSEHILFSRSVWRYWHQILGFSLAGSSLMHIYFNFRALKVLVRRLLS
ncbi:MAG: DUF4405 domain-containing protein [Candidatus Korarchaeum sp.]|nr:DUF4405 domain-containing protein [Candidatus Korarchaeum sp.]MDW8034893.1 DUF4405 domain-containing protein [Candidatus Korarchaeum sp.]